jgi:hypothetical protein
MKLTWITGKFRLHPLIYTWLEFSITQDIESCQRFPGLGNEPPQTGHTFFDHQVGFALRALDPVEFDSFDFFRLQSVTHLVLPLSSRCLWAD